MEEYPSNSQKKSAQKPEPPKMQKVTVGKVVVKKPGVGKRLSAAFTGDDGRSVLNHVIWDVLIPAAKDMIADAGRETIERALYGDSRPRRSSTGYNSIGSTLASRVNYNRVGYGQPERPPAGGKPRQITTRGRVTIDDIVLESRAEADEVILRLATLIDEYGRATVADLFDLVGVTGEYTDEKFGWVSMNGAKPHRTRDGYLLDLPRPVQID